MADLSPRGDATSIDAREPYLSTYHNRHVLPPEELQGSTTRWYRSPKFSDANWCVAPKKLRNHRRAGLVAHQASHLADLTPRGRVDIIAQQESRQASLSPRRGAGVQGTWVPWNDRNHRWQFYLSERGDASKTHRYRSSTRFEAGARIARASWTRGRRRRDGRADVIVYQVSLLLGVSPREGAGTVDKWLS